MWPPHLCEAFFIRRKLYSKSADTDLSHNTIQNVVCIGEALLALGTIRPDTARVEKSSSRIRGHFPLSPSWKMMRPISSMQGDTVPCRLTDFKAVRLCYVPPSLILEAVGGRFFVGEQILTPQPLLALSHFARYWQTYGRMHCFWDVFTLVSGYNWGPFHL